MSNNIKEAATPQIFDRVHSPYYGYGTVIGIEEVYTGYDAVILFDVRDNFLNSAGKYEDTCDVASFPVCDDVRKERCFWVRVYISSTEEGSLNNDEVRLVPFDSLEYRQHPIRVSLREGYSASIVVRDNNIGVIIIAIDKGKENDVPFYGHDGKGDTAYCNNILNTLWPKKDIYYWATTDELSFQEELMGTVPSFDIKEEDNNNNNNKEDEENADVQVEKDIVASPYYYKIARVEPNELMEDLMSFDQHEGFLWGNIIKYAYRYGNKGEKAETVKKIRKYCDMLLEILEPKSELED